MKAKTVWEMLKRTLSDWSEDRAPRLAAALAYYTIFSIAPVIIIVIAVAGMVFDEAAVRGEISAQLQSLVGAQAAEAIESMVANASRPTMNTIAGIVGVVVLIIGATGVFFQLQDALNTIWEVQPRPGQGIVATIRHRVLSFAMVLGIGFLLLVSLVLSATLSALGDVVMGQALMDTTVGQIVNIIVSFAVTTLLFAMIYKVLPDAKISWSDVWIGAAATSVLFTLGKWLIGLYLGRSALGSSYGAAGSLVILLVWIYYSAQILFLGAEFTQVYAQRFGRSIEPRPYAVRVSEDQRAREGLGHSKRAGATPEEAALPVAPRPAISLAFAHSPDGRLLVLRDPARRLPPERRSGGGSLLAFAAGLFFGARWIRRRASGAKARHDLEEDEG